MDRRPHRASAMRLAGKAFISVLHSGGLKGLTGNNDVSSDSFFPAIFTATAAVTDALQNHVQE